MGYFEVAAVRSRSMRLEVSHVIGQQQPMGAKGGIAPPLQLASNELNMLFC